MAEEEDFSQLPLVDQFTHKNWKARRGGYETAAKLFERTPDESDPAFTPFLQDSSLWKGAVADSNVAAQQDGLAALCAFLKYGGQHAATRTRGLTVTPICEKGLVSSKAAAKASSLEVLLLYVELDKSEPVIEALIPAFSHKQPKVVAGTLAAMTALYHNFGCKTVEYKPTLKALPKVFGHADKNVRAEASNLTVELYRWLREAMKAVFWSELKPVQQQDLEKLFEKVKEEPAPKQERFTRTQQAAMATAADTGGNENGSGEGGGADEGELEEVDAFDLAEPIDVLSKIPKDLHENLASSKWGERKGALDALYNVLNTPRIKDGQYDDIVRAMAKCMKDANIAVVTAAANCVEKLALGLRHGFAKYRGLIVGPMFERLKEKKQSVTDALGGALDAVFGSTSLSDNLEDTIAALGHKNPNVKLETLKFLVRCLRNTRDVPSKPEQKSIADAGTKLLTESSEVARSGGAEILGTLMKIIGERAMAPYLDGLDDIRKAKIKEYFDSAQVKAKERPKPVAGPPKAGPAPKKVVGGAKKAPASGLKKPTPAAAPAYEEPPAAPPSQPRPAPGKSLPRPGGLPKPGSGLAVPSSKLGALKKPSPVLSSPQRRVVSPPEASEPQSPAKPTSPPPQSRLGFGRGGLTSRPLGKPTLTSSFQSETATSSNQPPSSSSSGLSAIQLAELEELRLEKDRLTRLTEDLRSSTARLTTEVSELQNQNAQLIEDHTRDVLQIRAKEAQLVRAREENKSLAGDIETMRKDGERLKREMGRLGRESMGRERDSGLLSPTRDGPDAGIYSDGGSNGTSRPDSRASKGRPRSFQYPPTSPSEEKENPPIGAAGGRRKISPTIQNDGGFAANGSGRSSPTKRSNGGGPVRQDSTGGQEQGSEDGGERENWKRAAEVTSQLKQRIEMMKVSLSFEFECSRV
ncbi:MAG: hypothetical protein Q9160_000126 [Pyrenula sp. 1 TL-2023]